jgi:hypothetical protein
MVTSDFAKQRWSWSPAVVEIPASCLGLLKLGSTFVSVAAL